MGLNFSRDFDEGARLFLQTMGIINQQQQQSMMNQLYQSQLLTAEQQRKLGELQYKELEKGIGRKETFRKGVEERLSGAPFPYEYPTMTFGQVYGPEEQAKMMSEEYAKAMPEEYFTTIAKKFLEPEEFGTVGEGGVVFSKRTGKPLFIAPKEEKETIPSEMRQFELETGTSSKLQGTKQYQDAINEWRRNKRTAINLVMPMEKEKFAISLRKEFEDLRPVKDYRDTLVKYNIMKSAYEESLKTNNYVAVDQALITLFNKMTDPQSVVRESEYIRTSTDLALWHRLRGKIEKFKAGGAGLTQDDRKALLTMGSKFLNEYNKIYITEEERFKQYAIAAEIDPSRVVPKLELPKLEIEGKPIEPTKSKIMSPEIFMDKYKDIFGEEGMEEEMPSAKENKGKRIYDSKEKKWFRSDGTKWIEEKQ